jgi:hypothetical protein
VSFRVRAIASATGAQSPADPTIPRTARDLAARGERVHDARGVSATRAMYAAGRPSHASGP